MHVNLAYGEGWLPITVPSERATVIEPAPQPGLTAERDALRQALQEPIAAPPLREWLKPGARVCIVFTDITRATPNERIIPWLLEFLREQGVTRQQITLLNAVGTHRANTRDELIKMLGREVVDRYEVINHEPENLETLVQLGITKGGVPALINSRLVGADVRIITGFIEPHFFAGFSGGPKGIMPGVAGLNTVVNNHGSRNIGDTRATFGVTEGNPIWEEMRDIALRVGPSFLFNVTLNEQRQITGVFAGDLIEAHRAGTAFVRRSAMQPVAEPFEIVVTTNSGYPLDQNMYQAVKGMSAAAQIIRDGGTVIIAAECREGVPENSPHDRLLRSASSSAALLERIESPGFSWPEQWSTHIQALIQRRAEVLIHSQLPDEVIRRCHLKPCADISQSIEQLLQKYGPSARIAVLPQGPLTIPYVAQHPPNKP